MFHVFVFKQSSFKLVSAWNPPLQVHELTPDKLKMRDIVHIDIANDPVLPSDYKPDEDPTT